MSKPEYQNDSGRSAGEDLFAAGTASGLKAARARIRLRHGTLEPVVLPASSLSSRCKGRSPSEVIARARVPMRGTGAERLVVAMNCRNGQGAKGPCHSVFSTSQPRFVGGGAYD